MKRHVGGGLWVNIIGHDEAKTMTAEQIIARFHFDHYPIPHAEGGPDEPWNLDPVPSEDHAIKTATIDVPGIAKRKRVSAKHEAFRARLLAKGEQTSPSAVKRKVGIPSRPFEKRKRIKGD
jgi:hypothetical protein